MSANPEPTLADVMAAIGALSVKVDRIDAGLTRVEADAGQMRTEMNLRFDQVAEKFELARSDVAAVDVKVDRVQADIAQVRADVLAVKVEQGLHERHQADIQAVLAHHLADPEAHRSAA